MPTMTRPNDIYGSFLSPEAIALTPEQIDRAVELSQWLTADRPENSRVEDQQWQLYLSALALQGIAQWFQTRSPDLPLRSIWLNQSNQLDWSEAENHSTQFMTNLEVNGFKLVVIVADLEETAVSVPSAIVDRPEQCPHFYLLVEVLEEVAQIRVASYLRGDRLAERRRETALEREADTYLLPLRWFEPDSSQLLLCLQLLEPAAFRLPASSTESPSLRSFLSQQAVNAALWLRNQRDQAAQELALMLLPPAPQLIPGWAMRSAPEQLDTVQLNTVLEALVAENQIELPPQIGQAYQEVILGGMALRLYWIIGEIPTNASDWTLLLILMTPTGAALPPEIQLQVRDEMQLLVDRVPESSRDSYLYAQVQGGADEKFYVSLSLDTTETLTLPPVEFNLKALL